MLQRPPQPLDEDVVHPAAPAIHGDLDSRCCQRTSESRRGELRALIRIEDFRFAKASQSILKCREAERRVHCIRNAPSQNRAARPIDDRDEIEKASSYGQIRYIGRPDVIGPFDLQVAQQIGINLVAGRGLRRIRLWPKSSDPSASHSTKLRLPEPLAGSAHLTHQALHTLAVDLFALRPEHGRHTAGAKKRPSRE